MTNREKIKEIIAKYGYDTEPYTYARKNVDSWLFAGDAYKDCIAVRIHDDFTAISLETVGDLPLSQEEAAYLLDPGESKEEFQARLDAFIVIQNITEEQNETI